MELVKLERGGAGYPVSLAAALGKNAPSTLFCRGNLSLLEQPSVGFCGSRSASEKGIETARDCASQVAQAGLNVVSGNAAGVDSAAHLAALQVGGHTILVLPEGINHFRVKKVFEHVWDWSRVLVISQFDSDASWQVSRAMQRNQVIIGLSRAMIVIEAGETGGTLNAGIATLKTGIPLYVAVYDNMPAHAPGNERLLQMGGHRLSKSRSIGRANIGALLDAAEQPIIPCATSAVHTQLSFL